MCVKNPVIDWNNDIYYICSKDATFWDLRKEGAHSDVRKSHKNKIIDVYSRSLPIISKTLAVYVQIKI